MYWKYRSSCEICEPRFELQPMMPGSWILNSLPAHCTGQINQMYISSEFQLLSHLQKYKNEFFTYSFLVFKNWKPTASFMQSSILPRRKYFNLVRFKSLIGLIQSIKYKWAQLDSNRFALIFPPLSWSSFSLLNCIWLNRFRINNDLIWKVWKTKNHDFWKNHEIFFFFFIVYAFVNIISQGVLKLWNNLIFVIMFLGWTSIWTSICETKTLTQRNDQSILLSHSTVRSVKKIVFIKLNNRIEAQLIYWHLKLPLITTKKKGPIWIQDCR